MNEEKMIEYLYSAIMEIKALKFEDEGERDKIYRRLEMFIRRQYGSDSIYIEHLQAISLYPTAMATVVGVDYSARNKIIWEKGKRKWINLLETMIEEIYTYGLTEVASKDRIQTNNQHFTKVFIVHGHDGEMMQDAARFVEKLGLNPIILKEQPDEGRTIIEKFEDYSEVDFAIVLFSPDDLGKSKHSEDLNPRPRQNVVFELGFFIGKLGRENVVVLHKVIEDFEMLSDFQGVLFKPYREGWEISIAKELRAASFDVDFNKLL